MAHPMQLAFVAFIKDEFPNYFAKKKIVEIGSLDINGSIRKFFTDCTYVGVDVAPGPGVDIVSQGQDFTVGSGTFDVAISCECFEHNPHYLATLQNMASLGKPGALVVVTCATTGREVHGTDSTTPAASPLTVALGWNYYRNLKREDFPDECLKKWFDEYFFLINYASRDLYLVAITHSETPNKLHLEQLRTLYDRLSRHYRTVNLRKRALLCRVLTSLFGETGGAWVRKVESLIDSRR